MFRAVACVQAGPVTPPMTSAMTRVKSVQSIQRNIAINSKLKMLAARAVVWVNFFTLKVYTKMQYMYCTALRWWGHPCWKQHMLWCKNKLCGGCRMARGMFQIWERILQKGEHAFMEKVFTFPKIFLVSFGKKIFFPQWDLHWGTICYYKKNKFPLQKSKNNLKSLKNIWKLKNIWYYLCSLAKLTSLSRLRLRKLLD